MNHREWVRLELLHVAMDLLIRSLELGAGLLNGRVADEVEVSHLNDHLSVFFSLSDDVDAIGELDYLKMCVCSSLWPMFGALLVLWAGFGWKPDGLTLRLQHPSRSCSICARSMPTISPGFRQYLGGLSINVRPGWNGPNFIINLLKEFDGTRKSSAFTTNSEPSKMGDCLITRS